MYFKQLCTKTVHCFYGGHLIPRNKTFLPYQSFISIRIVTRLKTRIVVTITPKPTPTCPHLPKWNFSSMSNVLLTKIHFSLDLNNKMNFTRKRVRHIHSPHFCEKNKLVREPGTRTHYL